MLTIENFHVTIPDGPIGDNVHPFYHASIKCLFGVEIDTVKHSTKTRNRTILTSILHNTLRDNVQNICYFFDIRLQEELGSPSPQYELLGDLGLTTVLPVCIHGTDLNIVREGLTMADSILCDGQKALFAVSLLSSTEWQSCGYEFASAFLVSSNGVADSKIYIKGTMFNEKGS
jgi:hypothetical protein